MRWTIRKPKYCVPVAVSTHMNSGGKFSIWKSRPPKKHSIANVWKCYGVSETRAGSKRDEAPRIYLYIPEDNKNHTHRKSVSKAYINIKMIAPSSESGRRKRHSTVQLHTWDLWPHRCEGTDGDGSLANEGCTVCNNTEHRSGESNYRCCVSLLLLLLLL